MTDCIKYSDDGDRRTLFIPFQKLYVKIPAITVIGHSICTYTLYNEIQDRERKIIFSKKIYNIHFWNYAHIMLLQFLRLILQIAFVSKRKLSWKSREYRSARRTNNIHTHTHKHTHIHKPTRTRTHRNCTHAVLCHATLFCLYC